MKIVSLRPALALVLAAGCAISAQAQSPYVGEALNYSRLQFGGPARTQGIAGANVALGADFGNLTSNPAGLGLYQKSEIHLAPGLGLGSADASGTGGSQTADKNNFHIGSAGVVFTTRRPDGEADVAWRGGSFALGFTRLADYNTSFRYAGQVANGRSFFQRLREPGGSSVVNSGSYQGAAQDILNQANAGTDGIYTSIDGLAYGTYLTNVNGGQGNQPYTVTTLARATTVAQSETVTTAGSVSQFDLGYGGSYRDRLYIGAAVGLISSNRRQTRSFAEADNDTGTDFTSLLLTDEVKTNGTGINARLGVIYRATDALRLGASIQTPTFFRLTETSQTSLTSAFTQVPNDPLPNPATASFAPGEYIYNLTTPFRASGGAAVTIGKVGFLTGDVEYVGYQQARLSSADDATYGDAAGIADDNQLIRRAYQGTVNLRFGAEGRFDIFRVRVGYANYGDPYKGSTTSRGQQFYTAGVGVRQSSFFLDLAGVYNTFAQQYSPYAIASGQQPVINVNNNRYTTTVTAGLTF